MHKIELIKRPLVSVIICAYNSAALIEKTINSILSQEFQNYEIIVIDDGSIDNTADIVKGIKDDRIKYFFKKNTKSVSDARNLGILLSLGKYLAFCDHDDIWRSDKLSKQIKFLERNPQYSMVHARMIRFNDSEEWSVEYESAYANFKTLLYYNNIPLSSIVILKSSLATVGIFNNSKLLYNAFDYEFLLRYLAKHETYFIDEPLVKYYSGNNRMTALPDQDTLVKKWRYFTSIIYAVRCVKRTTPLSIKNVLLVYLFHFKFFLKSFLLHFKIIKKVKAYYEKISFE